MNFIMKVDVPVRSGLLLKGSGKDFRVFILLQGLVLVRNTLEYLCRTLAASFLMGVVPSVVGVAKDYHMHLSFSIACCWRTRSCVMNACRSSREESFV
jgi:hypothetical protein